MLQEWFFLELNGIPPFLAETCIAYRVQLRTPAQSSHNGGMAVTDQGDLHQPLYVLSGCLHAYKSVGGWASQYSSLIAIGIEIHISVKKALLATVIKAVTHQEPYGQAHLCHTTTVDDIHSCPYIHIPKSHPERSTSLHHALRLKSVLDMPKTYGLQQLTITSSILPNIL